jgi:hypothetical protein
LTAPEKANEDLSLAVFGLGSDYPCSFGVGGWVSLVGAHSPIFFGRRMGGFGLIKAKTLLFLQGGKCFYCGNTLDESLATVEHIVPSSKGGSNKIDNLVAVCKYINSVFGNMSPKQKIEWVKNRPPDFVCPHRHGEGRVEAGHGSDDNVIPLKNRS